MTEEQGKYEVAKPIDRAPINIDITKGITPHTYAELLQFAALYKDSGLAPKSFQTVQQLAIGIGMCIELDRPILTGIQDMAVINGRVSIFGDAALAVVRRSGLLEYIIEKETGKPYTDDWKFTCEIKRKGSPEPRIGVWTWEDSKRAGFDDPKLRDGGKDTFSPWRRFTRRMMQFKARNFPLRDEFGDVIKGMTLTEDAQDIIDVTPREEHPATSDDLTAAIKAQGKENAPGPEKSLEPPPNQDVGATSPPDAGETIGPKEAFRSEWVGLRTAGYSTYVHKNRKRIEEEGKIFPTVLQEMKDKWTKLYKEPWPFVEQAQATLLDTDKAPMDPETENFLAEAIRYHDVLVEKYWSLITDLFGMRGKDVKELVSLHVDHRPRFLDQCKRALDKQSE